jgi:putative exosortase-associated protein (TIGR04073 family)
MNKVFILCVVLLLAALPASRADVKENYFERSGDKFTRGLSNVVFSFNDFLKPFEQNIQRDQMNRAIIASPFEGIFRMLGRTFVGIYEIGTFMIPQNPILNPAYQQVGIEEYMMEGHELTTQRHSVPDESRDRPWY